MTKKPFTLNKKRLTMMTASAAMILTLAAPAALAAEPDANTTPIDDSREEVSQPAADEPTPTEPAPEEPTPTEPAPEEPAPTEPAVDDDAPVTADTDDESKPVRVIVKHVDEKGVSLNEDVQIHGDVGDKYETATVEIDGYEMSKVEGAEKGAFAEDVATVSYVYTAATPAPAETPPAVEPAPETPAPETPVVDEDEASPVTPVPEVTPEVEPPADAPIDDSAEEEVEEDEADGAAATSGSTDKGDGLTKIPQASAETSWSMVGAGLAAIGAAFMMLFNRRKKQGSLN